LSHTFFGYERKPPAERNLGYFIGKSTTISEKRSRRELSIDMVVERVIFKYKQVTPFFYLYLPKTGMGVPKTRVNFYFVDANK